MKVIDILEFIDSFAPFNTALPFDNAGLLVGDGQREINKIGAVLDVTAQAVEYAVQNGIDLIVSHHPVIFNPLKRLQTDSVPYLLAKHDIAVISAHTNLDAARGGVNDALAKALELENIAPLAENDGGDFPPMGRTGTLKRPMSDRDFAKFVAEKLSTKAKAVLSGKEIAKVALCGGAGEDFIDPALKAGADALVTADVKHHNLLLARSLGLCLIDAGHFETENVVVPILAEKLAAFSAAETVIIPQFPPAVWF